MYPSDPYASADELPELPIPRQIDELFGDHIGNAEVGACDNDEPEDDEEQHQRAAEEQLEHRVREPGFPPLGRGHGAALGAGEHPDRADHSESQRAQDQAPPPSEAPPHRRKTGAAHAGSPHDTPGQPDLCLSHWWDCLCPVARC